MHTLTTYLTQLQNIDPQDKEHTHRTYLHNFLESFYRG